jgi:prepilin-type processing-associated H-X9-DG protein
VNNLKQIGLALHNYVSEHKALPPAYTVDAQGRPLHSWRTLILPYFEQTRLYESIDLAKPWNDPANARALATSVSAYHCPSSPGEPNTTTYLATTAPSGCLIPGQLRPLSEITDAHESTLMVMEAGEEHAVPWMTPVDAYEALVMSFGPTTKVHHPGGANAGLVDGSVRFLKTNISAKTLRALMSIAGGEELLPQDW